MKRHARVREIYAVWQGKNTSVPLKKKVEAGGKRSGIWLNENTEGKEKKVEK